MATTREYTIDLCPECKAVLYYDVLEVGGPHVSPRYRKDGPNCGTTGCSLDQERPFADGFTTYY